MRKIKLDRDLKLDSDLKRMCYDDLENCCEMSYDGKHCYCGKGEEATYCCFCGHVKGSSIDKIRKNKNDI